VTLKMRIYAGGLETETNSFSPIPTGLADFAIFSKSREDTTLWYSFPDLVPFNSWQQKSGEKGHEFIFGFYAAAEPAGLTVQSAYECLRDDLLADIAAAGPVDIILLLLHGAMMAQGYDDCEGDLLHHIRQLVGPEVIIAVELDLHCHLTPLMLENSHIIITLKEYPHTDIAARGEELLDLAIATAEGHYSPVMALFDCKMVGMYPTTTPSMQSFIAAMVKAEQQASILSVSFIHSFPFGDMAEAGGKVLVVADNNQALAEQQAKTLGMHIVSLRHEIGFKSLKLEEALPQAVMLASQRSDLSKPVVVADQSDNAGGGAPSDATFALRWLLEHRIESAACAIFYDPQVVKLAMVAGVGAYLQVRLGGKMGISSGDPLDLEVEVVAIKGNYYHQFPQQQGEPSVSVAAGDAVALNCLGIDIIVSSNRIQCFCPSVFDDLGIPYRKRRLLIVKSVQHFYGAFAPIASDIIYMAGPGAVPPIVQQIPYQKMATKDKYPWLDTHASSKEHAVVTSHE
jgi:microcystin degradation protein MlrC